MNTLKRAFHRLYGEGPLHLLGVLASFAIVGAAIAGWFDEPAVSLKYILIWFAAAIVAHDLLLLPLYSALDRLMAMRGSRRSASVGGGPPEHPPGRVYVRVPVLLSGMLLLVFGPEILLQGDSTYHLASGQHQHVYLARYLVIVAVLFTLSGLAYVLSVLRRRAG